MKKNMKRWILILLMLFAPVLCGRAQVRAAVITVQNGMYRSDCAYRILDLTNQERIKNGLPALKMNAALMDAAALRAAETHIFFSHTRPDNSSCFTVNSRAHGENLVCCSASTGTPEKLMDLWMNSAGHRANILNSHYRSVGIACCQIGNMINAVQIFCWYEPEGTPAEAVNTRRSVRFRAASENLNLTFGGISSISLNEWKKTSVKLTVKNIDTQVFSVAETGAEDASVFWHWVNAVPLAPGDFTWTSSNPSVAAVKRDGTVVYKGEGAAMITASLPDSGLKLVVPVSCEKNAPFKVTVKKKSVIYNGKKQRPGVTVKADGKIISSKYYKVSYSANKNVGTATVTVTGKGKYAHYLGKAAFTIKLRQGVLSSVKSKKKNSLSITWKKDAQAEYYEVQYSTSKSFKKNVRTVRVSAKTAAALKNLTANKTYYVRVRPAKAVGKKTWYGAWSAVKSAKVK